MTAPLLHSLREQIGHRYAIERELGRGGMGAVYLARDRQLDRPVALKVLPPEVASEPGLRERFLRETRLVAGFSHPNIVPVFGIEESESLLAFAMGFVEGESLSARVQRGGPLSVREAVRLLQDIGYALAYAHGRGIVHRDLKPDNIMIERATGRALLMDFGIARAVDTPQSANGLTRVGEIVGTPEFMSPEQVSGDALDGRSDLYSLGLVAYYAMTGTLAISGDSVSRIVVKQLTEPVPSVSIARGDVPEALAAVVDRCTAKSPDARFASAEALVDALDAAQLAKPEVATPVREFAQELSALPIVLLVGWLIIDLMLDLNTARGWARTDGLTSITLVLAIMGARVVQAINHRRRLHALGFDGIVLRGQLEQLLDERAAYRVAMRAKPEQRARQRLWLGVGVLMLLSAPVLGRIAGASRTQIGPMRYYVPPWAMVAFFATSAMLGIGIVLIGRSSILALGDRSFRMLWLGPLGRLLLGSTNAQASGRTVPPTGAERSLTPLPERLTASARTLPPAPLAAAHGPAELHASVRDLERRVVALEAHAARNVSTPASPSPST